MLATASIVRALRAAHLHDAPRAELLRLACEKIRGLGAPYISVYAYMLHGDELVLEAFSGRETEHTRIPVGHGAKSALCGHSTRPSHRRRRSASRRGRDARARSRLWRALLSRSRVRKLAAPPELARRAARSSPRARAQRRRVRLPARHSPARYAPRRSRMAAAAPGRRSGLRTGPAARGRPGPLFPQGAHLRIWQRRAQLRLEARRHRRRPPGRLRRARHVVPGRSLPRDHPGQPRSRVGVARCAPCVGRAARARGSGAPAPGPGTVPVARPPSRQRAHRAWARSGLARTMFRILDDLIRVGETGLRELWLRGSAPATEELVGWVFRGWNTARVAGRSPVGGRAFAKGFFRDGAGVAGCNFVVRVRAGEWHIDTGRPFGFFAVTPAADWRRRRAALLLD